MARHLDESILVDTIDDYYYRCFLEEDGADVRAQHGGMELPGASDDPNASPSTMEGELDFRLVEALALVLRGITRRMRVDIIQHRRQCSIEGS